MNKEKLLYFIDGFIIKIFNSKTDNKLQNNIAIVKLDALGDGILWIKAINAIANHFKLKQKKVFLFCSSSMEDFYKNYSCCDEIVGLNLESFQKISGRIKIVKLLTKFNFDIALNAVYSRSSRKDDFVMRAMFAREKISYKGDSTNFSHGLKCPKFYNSLFDTTVPISETLLASNFVRQMGIKFEDSLPSLEVKKENFQQLDYFVISLGASNFKRAWPVKKFSDVISWVLDNTKFNIKILGVKKEQDLFNELENYVKSDRIENLIGKTTLEELFNIVANSKFAVTNDTGIGHIVGALNTPGIVLLGGGNNDRFFPHVGNNNEKSSITIIQNKMDCYGCGWHCIYKQDSVWECVNSIETNDVIENIKNFLGSK